MFTCHGHPGLPANREHLPDSVQGVEHGKPDAVVVTEHHVGTMQIRLTPQRVQDGGASEGLCVTRRIRGALEGPRQEQHHPTRKRADFHRVVTHERG